MRIQQGDGFIAIDQTAYLQKVLQHFGMTNAKAAVTLLPAGYVPSPNSDPLDEEMCHKYQQVIGSLLYIMLGTRPDIAFAVTRLTKLSQFTSNPSKDHLAKALYICKYLVSTADYKLIYSAENNEGIYAFADSDWASDITTRRSTTGFMVKLASGIFSWNTRVQCTVTLSSTEAEYMLLSDACKPIGMGQFASK